jgi:hypothetical protein
MKETLGRALLVALIGLVAACSDGEHFPNPSGVGDSGAGGRTVSDANLRDSGGTGGSGGADDAPVDAEEGDAAGDVPAPNANIKVTINQPTMGAVVPALLRFTPEVEVRVEGSASRAEETLMSLVAAVVGPDGKTLIERPLNQVGLESLPESGVVTYRFAETPIDLAGAVSGSYQLEVTATLTGGAEVMASGTFLIDAGPVIRIDSPVKDKPYRGSAAVDVSIHDDLFAPVSEVQMKIGQTAVTFAGPGGATGQQYTATLDFASFMPALQGEQILTVRAKNKNGTEAVLTRKFISDSTGPVITDASPKSGDLVGNVINIAAAVNDPAGVLSSSVVAVFANGPGTEYTVPLAAPAAGSPMQLYTAIFDTRLLPFGENALFPTLSFRASDNLGNESLISSVVWLDNRPPLAALDPPQVRILRKNDLGVFTCGWPFDPVGADVADDMDLVTQIVDIRARIEDTGNEVLSGSPNYIPISGTAVAQLLILDDTSQPLLVNTNPVPKGTRKADQTCDAINPLLVPTTRPMTAKDALLVTLVPIAPAGAPDQTNHSLFPDVLPGDDGYCFPKGGNAAIPDPICETASNFSKARPHQTVFLGYAGGTTGRLPSIFTIPSVETGAQNPLCGGTQLDALANFISDGWACLAVFASDNLGNKQVSAPLRICVDKDLVGNECPHKAVTALAGSPAEVTTASDHGYLTGDKVRVNGVGQAITGDPVWTITVTGPRTFTLDGSTAGSILTVPSHVVRVSDVPNCTGTQTAEPPMTAVDNTACQPWAQYPLGEVRRY